MNNEQLRACIEKVHSGDKEAFANIYNDMKTPIFTIICRITYDKKLSENVMHDLFVKLYQSPPDLSVNNPRAWIFRMARNLALNSTRIPQMEELNEEYANPVELLSETVSMKVDIAEAMKRLPHDEVEIVSFHVYGEMKFREIAEMLHTPLGTVLWKYQKAIRKLRTYRLCKVNMKE